MTTILVAVIPQPATAANRQVAIASVTPMNSKAQALRDSVHRPEIAATVTPAVAPSTRWSIAIATGGRQAALDTCVWVRMTFTNVAPIVGAHNRCGGDIVLAMKIGDTVEMSGMGLEGSYRVTDARDASAGELAQTATAGLGARVILQTCYYGGSGRERLVALQLNHNSTVGANGF